MKTNEKRELSYFQSLLGKYISEHHPELSNDKAFLSSRADEALNVYANAITIGLSDLEAEEAANEVLYNGLHFSKYDTIVEVLWNEFAENIPQSLAERLAAILWAIQPFRKHLPNINLMMILTENQSMMNFTLN